MAAALPLLSRHDRPKRFSRAEYAAWIQALGSQRLELLNGELIDKMGQNPPHAVAVALVAAWAYSVFGAKRIRNQSDLDVSAADQETNFPVPDLTVLQGEFTQFVSRHPFGFETRLVVEVSDSSLTQDLGFKAGLYARAGVPEYWVLDLKNRALYLHREAKAGQYSERRMLTGGDPLPFGEGLLDDLLPPESELT